MISALVALVTVVVVLGLTLFPLLGEEPARVEVPEGPDLAAQREDLLSALRDVDLDHAMGKITSDDRERLSAELEGRAVRIMAEIDQEKSADARRGE